MTYIIFLIEESCLQSSDDGILVERRLEVDEVTEAAEFAPFGVVGLTHPLPTSLRSRLFRRGPGPNGAPAESSTLLGSG